MGNKYLTKATEEEKMEFSNKLHEVLGRMLAHQYGMENPQIILSHKGKEEKRIG